MITNERQYRLTRAHAKKLRGAIEAFDAKPALASGIDPLIVRAQFNALKSQHEELMDQIAEYERIKSAPASELSAKSLDELPEVLIKARIAQKLSQKDLAQRLRMKNSRSSAMRRSDIKCEFTSINRDREGSPASLQYSG